MKLSEDIICIKNIGEERSKKLRKLGINSIEDLIEYFPRNYEDRSVITPISEICENFVFTIKAKVLTTPTTIKLRNISITSLKISDETGVLKVVWFNQPYLKNSIKVKETYVFTGKVVKKGKDFELESPDYEIVCGRELLSNGRIIPIYSSTYKFTQKLFRGIINDTLKEIKDQISEFLPLSIREKYSLCDRKFAISNIHFPKDNESFFKARERLVFEELFLLQMKLLELKGSIENKISSVKIKNMKIEEFIKKLAFKLTDAQEKVLEEIYEDFKQNKIINRLVQGDVGSGKTVIAQILSYIMVNNGYQVAVMVPTDVLASQHFESFQNIFSKLGIRCGFLSGSQNKKEKRNMYELIESGTVQIVVGTHAIIQDKVKFKSLGLVVTDEQHRFGVKQRQMLCEKGENPHTIVMTATPIPRTLALILYGDLDISTINELPPGRQKIDTSYVNSTYYERIYTFVQKNIEDRRQVYIICPMIEENEKSELKSVITYTEKLKKEVFNKCAVEFIHGKMKSCEKQEIMSRFYKGEVDILVSTTVIEVGINVPNATVMIIENAERFGISQLHQLRGRIGRGSHKSYCILVSDAKSKVSQKRLKMMTKYTDGFILSEKDLEIRGPGDFFGTMQHGLPELKIANLYKDIEILQLVQKAAKELYLEDSKLELEENLQLKYRVNKFFESINNRVAL